MDKLFTPWDRSDSPGCALGIIQDGQLVYRRGYGMANLEHDVPISSQTVFRIASTSKQFTAMCVALLAEEGRLSLDDDIRKYLPEMPEYERPITIRHLIYHTSGIRDHLELMGLAGIRDEDFYTDDEVMAMLARQKRLNFTPGDEYLYSNTGYYLLGVIVQRASGQSLREFAEEGIFRPLGMTSTRFHDDHTEVVKGRAAGYSPAGGGGYRIDMTTLDIVGDGGVFTTVEDLFLWDQNFYHNRLGQGSDDLIRQVLTPGTTNDGQKLGYAFGLRVGDYRGLRMVSHGGAYVGFQAEMIRFPEQRFSVICLANLSTIDASRLARQVADIYLAGHFKGHATGKGEFIELPAEVLADRIGVYRSVTTGTIAVLSLQDGKLMAEAFGESVHIAPVSESEFVTVEAPFDAQIRFEGQDQDRPFGHGRSVRAQDRPFGSHSASSGQAAQDRPFGHGRSVRAQGRPFGSHSASSGQAAQDTPWRMRLHVEDDRPDTLEMIEVVSPSADQLAEYTGDYYSEELQVTYRLVLEGSAGAAWLREIRPTSAPQDSRLYVRYRSAPKDPLRPGLRDMFWVGPITLVFSRDGEGQVSGFTLQTGRVRNVRFVRVHSG